MDFNVLLDISKIIILPELVISIILSNESQDSILFSIVFYYFHVYSIKYF
jgi:hypothetical protein